LAERKGFNSLWAELGLSFGSERWVIRIVTRPWTMYVSEGQTLVIRPIVTFPLHTDPHPRLNLKHLDCKNFLHGLTVWPYLHGK